MKKAVFLIPLVLALTACGTQVQNPVSEPISNVEPLTSTSSIVQSGALVADASGTGTEAQAAKVAAMSVPLTVESIKTITSLEDLKKINPLLANDSKNIHPKFIELQKANMTLGILLSQLKNPEYIKLSTEQNEIYQGKAIWTEEIKKTHESFLNALKNPPKSAEDSKLINAISLKNIQAIQEFQLKKEYQDYISTNQKKLSELNDAIKKLYTPEMTELQEKIQKLNAEVYAVKDTKTP